MEERKVEGLGGWLILVGIGIVLAPLMIIYTVFPIYFEIFSNGSWEIAMADNPLWLPIAIGELLINGALIVVWIFIAYLFFSKNKIFPKWFISVLLFTPIFILADALAVKIAYPDEPLFDAQTIKDLARILIYISIWMPYILVSKRVKATFVK
jgi:uncharacterized membrane protein YhdT